MDPTLDKRLSMTVGGEFRGNFNIYYEGDADSTDNAWTMPTKSNAK